jgi:ABC-type Zn2+ transport system substrate-binding protein/surface adhesin
MLPMLRGFFRIFSLALLVLAVPLQGMASVAAGQCMALGHHQDAGDGDHAHDDGDGHDHDAPSHADDGKHPEEDGTTAHCGPCAACCASVSIAPLSDITISPPPASAQYVFSQFPPIGIETDGVYRPPLPL